MKVILFDLGNTLEQNDAPLPGAIETLESIRSIADEHGEPLAMGLVSDFDMPDSSAGLPVIREAYMAILDKLGIRHFFEPVSRFVTLSSDVGVFKPDARIFREALDRVAPDLPFSSAMFITENPAHVAGARRLGMQAVHFKGPGQTRGDITRLADLIPLAEAFARNTALGAVRFGKDLFRHRPAETGTHQGVGAERVASADLYLVVQKGRRFQKSFPEIPVLYDRGRFLVVSLDGAQAAQIGEGAASSFGVMPLSAHQVAFTARERSSERLKKVPWVGSLADRIDQESLRADLEHLVSFPTRHSATAHYLAAAEWCFERLSSMGYQVTKQPIHVGSSSSSNVIAERSGSGQAPRGVLVVTAHLDSVNHEQPGDILAPAPGADDNGSGSAGLLQLAEALKDHPNIHDLRFILFGGEEQGLHGSKQYVAGLSASERKRIQAVLNMDMIGCLNRLPATVLLEGAALSQDMIDGLVHAAETYTDLALEISLNPFASDHVPFINAGIPAVLTIEGADQENPHEHTHEDTLEIINYPLAQEILRMNVAFIAEWAGHANPGDA